MFKRIADAFFINLQGTIFQLRKRHGVKKNAEQQWQFQPDASKAPPYVLTDEEYKVKNDIITKVHSVDNNLQASRRQSRAGRARWFVDMYEQCYDPPVGHTPNPQVEVYYRALGLDLTRDPRITLTGFAR